MDRSHRRGKDKWQFSRWKNGQIHSLLENHKSKLQWDAMSQLYCSTLFKCLVIYNTENIQNWALTYIVSESLNCYNFYRRMMTTSFAPTNYPTDLFAYMCKDVCTLHIHYIQGIHYGLACNKKNWKNLSTYL